MMIQTITNHSLPILSKSPYFIFLSQPYIVLIQSYNLLHYNLVTDSVISCPRLVFTVSHI